jgi:CheB methylesterase
MIRSPAPDSGLPCFVIAAASGGLQAFSQVLAALQSPVPPILAIQRIHPAFTAAFAERLQRACPLAVAVAAEGDRVLPDRVLVAPGDCHIRLVGIPSRAWVSLDDDLPEAGNLRPEQGRAGRRSPRRPVPSRRVAGNPPELLRRSGPTRTRPFRQTSVTSPGRW